MKRRLLHKTAVTLAISLACLFSTAVMHAQTAESAPQEPAEPNHTVSLGDTWDALARRSGSDPTVIMSVNHAINPQRQPAVGSTITLPRSTPAYGRLLRPLSGGSLQLAAQNGQNPWTITLSSDLPHPYIPLLYTPLFLPGGSLPPLELPAGLEELALAPGPLTPGSALALRVNASHSDEEAQFLLDGQPLIVTQQGQSAVILGATGAFYPPGQHLLAVRVANNPLWEQPLTFADRDWTWEELTFNNTAVLDPEAIQRERERLGTIWDEVTPKALWQGFFRAPISDFVEISSQYGARRSVNGGPYSSYHEGTDFSAYGGSAVTAPAAGNVVLAEELAIRGGAVILDHGLGLHSGYYHLSAIHVTPGQQVQAGDLLGEVGTTGRSTGNHLHWDLLIGRTWIDPLQWLDQNIHTWLSPAPPPAPTGPGPVQ